MSADGMSMTIPEWVPVAVARTAEMISQASGRQEPAVAPLLERLLCDPRMKTVWDELRKRKRDDHRPTAEPFHSASLPAAIESWGALAGVHEKRAAEFRAIGNDQEAKKSEFIAAHARRIDQSRPSKPLPLAQQEDLAFALAFAAAVANFTAWVETLNRHELNTIVANLRKDGREAEADAYAEHAGRAENAQLIVERHRTDPRLEAYIEGMGKLMRALYADPLYGTIATIANVVFERNDLDRERVRAILRPRKP